MRDFLETMLAIPQTTYLTFGCALAGALMLAALFDHDRAVATRL